MTSAVWLSLLAELTGGLLTLAFWFVILYYFNERLLRKWYPDQYRKPGATPPTPPQPPA